MYLNVVQRRLMVLMAAAFVPMAVMACNESTAATPAATNPATEPAGKVAEVTIDNFTFAPATITVAAGTTVKWTNKDDVPHTATGSVKPRAFDSGALDTDQSYSHTFNTPGTYDYFCAVHPHMTGKVVVK